MPLFIHSHILVCIPAGLKYIYVSLCKSVSFHVYRVSTYYVFLDLLSSSYEILTLLAQGIYLLNFISPGLLAVCAACRNYDVKIHSEKSTLQSNLQESDSIVMWFY